MFSLQVEPRWGYFVLSLPRRDTFVPVSSDWAHVYKVTHTAAAKYRSALIRLANPSSNASRCVFLASPR